MRSIATLLLLALCTAAGASEWRFDQGRLEFEAVAQGESFRGEFARFTPTIHFDPDALDQARFEVRIELGSADTRNEERDETLVGDDFFAVETEPLAHYRASSFRAEGDGFVAEGELELRGVVRPVPLRFTWEAGAGGAVLEGEATLDRLEFEVGTGDWADTDMIGREVQVRTRLELVPAQ